VTQNISPEPESLETTVQNDDVTLHPAITIEINEAEKNAHVTIKKTDSFPTYTDVIEALRATGIPYWIDEDAIRKELDRSLFDKSFAAAFVKDGKLEIKIEKHDSAAYLLLKPAYGGNPITLNDIKEKIAQAGIVFGIDMM